MVETILESIFEIINSAIIIINKENGAIKLANKKARIIFKDEDGYLNGKHFDHLFHPDNHLDAQNIINFCNNHGEFEGEVLLKRLDNTYFVAMISCSALVSNNSTIKTQYIIVVLHDISRLKGMERLLRISKRLAKLGDMLDDISHQIRNPILTIGGLAKRLQKCDNTNKDYLEIILKQCHKLETLLNKSEELINLTRPKPLPYKIVDIISNIDSNLKELSEEYEIPINIEKNIDHHNELAIIDLSTTKDILTEIIKNAKESYQNTKKSPELLISMESLSDKKWALLLSFKDFGVGIKPQHIDKVFDPFFTTKTDHIGIGLTKAKMLIEEQAGKITIESVEGEGTVVKIYIQKELRTVPRVTPPENLVHLDN